MNRMLTNWQTSLAGLGVLIVTAAQWLSGDMSLSLDQVISLLIGAGFIAGKDAQTGSAPTIS